MTDADTLLCRCMLALCVWREARGETRRGMQLVAQVIENRKDDPRWPHDYVSVIVQPFQFSSFNANDPNSRLWPHPGADPSWTACVDASDSVLNSPAKMTFANHYHVRGLEPSWADPTKITDIEGHHVFYKL